MALTPKQARFVSEYLIDLNATQAAIRTGYKPNAADVQGARLLANASVSSAIAEKTKKQLERADLTASRVLEELRRLSFSNVQTLFDAKGNLKPIQDLTPEEASAIASLEIIKKNAEAGDGKIDVVHKLKVWDKTRSLEMLAKHFALLTDVVRVDASEANIARLIDGRKRAAAQKA